MLQRCVGLVGVLLGFLFEASAYDCIPSREQTKATMQMRSNAAIECRGFAQMLRVCSNILIAVALSHCCHSTTRDGYDRVRLFNQSPRHMILIAAMVSYVSLRQSKLMKSTRFATVVLLCFHYRRFDILFRQWSSNDLCSHWRYAW